MSKHHATYEEAKRLAEGIHRLAHNIWWTWNPDAQELFAALSEEAWVDSRHNAMSVIKELSNEELIALLLDDRLAKMAQKVIDHFDDYLTTDKTWANANCAELQGRPIAYFSAEFGLHESLPIYSGGLGILAGDHIKSASDLGLPFIGITLFYRNTYFSQQINHDGWQIEEYPRLDPANLPLEKVCDKNGNEIVCSINIAHTEVKFHAWQLKVGRTTLYLLDTLRHENDVRFQEITSRVYGGDHTTRVCQELMLGVGGVKLLRALNVDVSTYHLNEGHSSFLLLELLREEIHRGKSIKEAEQAVVAKSMFTTHTPVPAGHDRFSRDLLDHLMHTWPAKLGITMEQFMDYGREQKGDEHSPFTMTVLALRLTRSANGVSELHGKVSREMWRFMYPEKKAEEVPIGHITNGIHVLGWMNRVTHSFWDYRMGEGWEAHLMKKDFWEKVEDTEAIRDEEIWALRQQVKRQMIEAVRKRVQMQNMRLGYNMPMFNKLLNPDALTIGFSRRFATYKRAALLFSDIERAARLFTNTERPIQIVFAGKAHPRDDMGKGVIQHIVHMSRDPRFSGKVIFVENYDIQIARYLISGSDIWLNNPRRPLEASGTSGQKCAVHGCINFSILDGWWREAYDGKNGFAIGDDSNPGDPEEQDRQDTINLYETLENVILPEFYDRDETNIPRAWLKRVRHAMVTLIPQFSTDRMVAEYATKYYMQGK